MVVGFVTLGTLMLYAVILILIDFVKQKREYENEIKSGLAEMEQLGFTPNEIAELRE